MFRHAQAVLIAAATAMCSSSPPGASRPPAEVFDVASDFSGEWIGEVAGMMGALHIERLSAGRYYGIYRVDDEPTKYVLNLEQVTADGGGEPRSNRADFTWQDGHGGRGHGWLLINREDSALAGDFGFGEHYGGAGAWAFIRVE